MSIDANEPRPPAIGHWRSTALVAAVVTGAYLLLLNPYWTPGGDSELFISAARSIVRGEGYSYNGRPVFVSPPAWPYVMAGAMWISPTFLMLKLVTLLMMAGAWVMAHRALLRLGSALWATLGATLGALLVPVYSLTFWLHSEPLFCLLAWAAMLMALRAAEDRTRTLDLLGVILCCGAMASVRWTGGLQWGIVASGLLGGWGAALRAATGPDEAARRGRAFDARTTIGLATSALVTLLVFVLLFFVLPRIASAVMLDDLPGAAGPDASDLPVTSQDAEDDTPDLVDNTIFDELSPLEERAVRLVASGHWVSWALWYPMRFAGGVGALNWIPLVLGWVVIALLALAAWRGLLQRGRFAAWPLARFVWPALLGYVFVLVFVWPLPNARYLVPVAPLLVMAVLAGCAGLGEVLARAGVGRILGGLFVTSLIAANGAMYVVDVVVQRSGDTWLAGGSARRYYATYEAGLHLSLLRAVEVLREKEVADHQLAVSERYHNLDRMRFSKSGPRNVVMLLDREVISPPDIYSFAPGEIPEKLFEAKKVHPLGFPEWARRNRARYYLFQQPSQPWRLWHFRVPRSLQSRLSPEEPEPDSFGWLLFSAEDGFAEPVPLPEAFTPPTRVPGL